MYNISKKAIIIILVFLMAVGGVLPELFISPVSATTPESDFIFDSATGTITGYTGSGGNVEIPDTIGGVAVTSIGYDAFIGCRSLTSVTIPDSVTSIDGGTFYGCSSLTSVTIPNSVTSIGNSAFRKCSSLTSVTIPNSVTSIGFLVFYGCSSLTSITIPNSVTSIDGGTFYGCSSLTSVTIPNSVTSIGSLVFVGCSSLTSVTIPDSVTSIGERTFYRCSSLTSVTIPNSVTSIGDGTFYGCSSLTSVTIPDSVTSIGDSAFSGCTSLTSVTIPNSVTSIGYYAFYGCSSLTSVTIPDSVTSIGYQAFVGCSSLTSVYFEGNIPSIFGYGVFSNCEADFKIYYNSGATGWTNPWNGYPTVKKSTVTFIAGANGSLLGSMSEVVNEGNSPVSVPTPNPGSGYHFIEWKNESGNTVTPSTEIITDNITYTAIFKDITPPNAPLVTGTTPTNDTAPTWSWSSGGNGGNGTYRYKLDDSDLNTGAAETTSTSYTPGSDLSEASHTLYVQERDAAGNWSTSGSFEIIIDTTAPTVDTLSPVDDAIEVGINDNLVITFNEDVVVGTGNITIKQISDNSIVETIDVTGSKVSVSAATVIIDPDVTFTGETGYYVQIDATAFDDEAGNSYAGIADTTSWSFTTVDVVTITIQSTNITRYGRSNGSITVIASGGSGSYEYSKDNGVTWQDSNVFNGLNAGKYKVQARDSADTSNESTVSTVTITQPPAPIRPVKISILKTNVMTIGGNDGSITVTASGESGSYKYRLDGGTWQSSSQFTGLTAGSYQVQAKDNRGKLSNVRIVTIIEPAPVTITIQSNNVSTYEGNDGSITVTASGGNGSYEYKIDRGAWQSSNQFTGLTEGSYQVKARDSEDESNESNTSTVTIVQPNNPSEGETSSGSSEPDEHPVDKAIEEGEKNEEGQQVGVIEINEPNNKGEYEQDIPAHYFEEEEKVLKIETPIASVTLPDNMFTEKPKGEIELSIKKVPKDELPKEIRKEFGDKPVIDINLMVNGEKEEWSNDSVEVEIAIAYNPTEEELKDPNKIIAVYIADNGEIIPLTLSSYDPEKGAVILKTDHFSYYGVQYADKNFEDIGSYTWAEEAIETLLARGVINGITEKEFAPQANITRADFVVLITRFFGLKGEATENFSDVKTGTYYYHAVGIAKEMGIVSGTGDNKFKPLEPISRQDMMVIIKRALEITGQNSKLTESNGKKISDFNDNNEVASYAKDSVEYLIRKGIVSGDGKNINPRSYTKRAEVVALLYKVLNILNK